MGERTLNQVNGPRHCFHMIHWVNLNFFLQVFLQRYSQVSSAYGMKLIQNADTLQTFRLHFSHINQELPSKQASGGHRVGFGSEELVVRGERGRESESERRKLAISRF